MELFDSHAHLSPISGAAGRLLHAMDANHIGKTIVMAGGSLSPLCLSQQILYGGGTNVSLDNLGVLEMCQAYEDRLLPFYFANPYLPPTEYEKIGEAFFGLKLAPAVHGITLEDNRTTAYLEVAEQLEHTVYLHCLNREGFTVSNLVSVAESFPKLTFILGHAGIGNCDFLAVSLIESVTNIFFETSGGFTAVIQEACNRLGHHRVLFGSEYPIQQPRAEIEKLLCIDLTEAQRADVFGNNISRLILGATRA